jgi:serine/threonine protein kinase
MLYILYKQHDDNIVIIHRMTTPTKKQFTYETPNVVSSGIPQFTYKTPNVVSSGIPQFTYETPNVVSSGIPQFTYKTPNVVSSEIPQYVTFNNLSSKVIIHNKYIITDKLGKGKFGEVYKGYDIHTTEPVAIKLEHHITPKPNPYSKYKNKQNDLQILKHETQILNFLHNRRCRNIPHIYWFGNQNDIPALVMPYYEYSLFDLFTQTAHNHTKYTFSVQTRQPAGSITPETIMRSIIRILENIHAAGVVHRDIKPHNFMIKNQELILIDFGMATFYVDTNNRHIPEPETLKEHLLGTQKYISINIHYGKEYTRRDDLISAGYLYLFLRNWLIWDRVYISADIVSQNTISIKDQYSDTHISHPKNNCLKMSKELSNIEKCLAEITGNNTHRPILEYFRYTYGLGFNQTPNYELLGGTTFPTDPPGRNVVPP